MTKKYTRYEKDFKLDATKLVTEHGYSCAEVSRRLGIPNHLVGSWVKAFKKSGDLPADAVLSPAAEYLKVLREEVAKLRMENEILKKATVYYSILL
jgi:transposase